MEGESAITEESTAEPVFAERLVFFCYKCFPNGKECLFFLPKREMVKIVPFSLGKPHAEDANPHGLELGIKTKYKDTVIRLSSHK